MSDNLTETLAALGGGDEPPCPFCAKPLVGDHRKQHLRCEWKCGTWHYAHSRFIHRGVLCFEREIAALREENARLRADSDAMATRLYDLRHTLDDAHPDGKTALDFFNVWLDQERAEIAALRERIKVMYQQAFSYEGAMAKLREENARIDEERRELMWLRMNRNKPGCD